MSSPTLSKALLLAALPFSQAAALSSPFTSLNQRAAFLEGRNPMHQLASIDITDGIPDEPPTWFNASDDSVTSLDSRNPIRYCVADTAQAGVCIAIGSVLGQLGTGIATVVKSKSKNHDCSAVTKQLNDITWRVHAEDGCHVKAELKTIAGAIENYLRDMDKNICGTHCIRMTHGASGRGMWRLRRRARI